MTQYDVVGYGTQVLMRRYVLAPLCLTNAVMGQVGPRTQMSGTTYQPMTHPSKQSQRTV